MSPPKYRKARRRKKVFRIDHIRRREIERLARHVGAGDTEDLERYLLVWARHNRQSNDPVWAIRNAARHYMGGPDLTAEEAEAISQAATFYKAMTADAVAEELRVTWDQRRTLKLKTIGALGQTKEDRKEIRRVLKKVAQEKKRRAAGVQPRAKYEAYSLSATKPWRGLGMSRRTWYRQNKPQTGNGTSAWATYLLTSYADDTPVPTGGSPSSFPNVPSDSLVVAAPIHVSMSHEARFLALGIRPRRTANGGVL
jgi:hypothetical protein